MSNMPAYKGKDVTKALKKKGFEESNGDHKFLVLHIDGKKSQVHTKISHGAKTYTGQLMKMLKDQLRVGNTELRGLLDCPMSHEQYVEYLNGKLS